MILIALWFLVLAFVIWEFINAEHMPKKYAKLSTRKIRVIDVVMTVLILFTIFALHNRSEAQNINSFDSCAKAGRPVEQLYPRVCQAEGHTFTE